MQKITKEMAHFGSNKSNAAKSDVGVQLPLTQNSLLSNVFPAVAFLCCLLVQDLFGQPPTITGFTPASGPVGTTVTVTGANFSTTPANNIVIFGATRATVSASTSTQLTVTVPGGATYSYIAVLNTSTGLLAYSSEKFTPTFAPANANLTSSHLTVGGGFATGDYPIALAIADLDGDGKTDIAVINYFGNTISVFKNTSTVGTIRYDTRIDYPVGVNPHAIAIGDLDGDGKPDLAVANLSGNTVSVLRNTSSVGTISFAAKVDFATAAEEPAASITIGDLDGDGKSDLVVGTRGATICLLRNTSIVGSISYAPMVNVVTGGSHDAIAMGDLDGDGKPDVVVVNHFPGTISVIRNASTVGLFRFDAAVSFPATTFPTDVSIGDLDGDGKLDLAAVSYATTGVAILRNTSTGVGDVSFADVKNIATNTNSLSIDIGDMDGDGKLDIVVEDTGYYNIFVYKNISTVGAISYSDKVAVKLGGLSGFISIGDLDDDGMPDLAFSHPPYDVVGIVRNNPVSAGSPTVTAFTPTSGTIGTSVTITGSNFSATPANNSVKFNGTAATVTASTATSITTTVPAGATSGRITVTAGGNTGTSSGDFTVTVAQPEINIKQNTLTVTSAGTYAFGDQTINIAGAPVTFTIENTGGGVLNLSGNPKVAIAGAHASAFTVIQTATTATVQAAATTSFTVSFAPPPSETKQRGLALPTMTVMKIHISSTLQVLAFLALFQRNRPSPRKAIVILRRPR